MNQQLKALISTRAKKFIVTICYKLLLQRCTARFPNLCHSCHFLLIGDHAKKGNVIKLGMEMGNGMKQTEINLQCNYNICSLNNNTVYFHRLEGSMRI